MKYLLLLILTFSVFAKESADIRDLSCDVRPSKNWSLGFEIRTCLGKECYGTIEFDNYNHCELEQDDDGDYWSCTEAQVPSYNVIFKRTRKGNLRIKRILGMVEFEDANFSRLDSLMTRLVIHSKIIIKNDQVFLKRGFKKYKMECTHQFND